MDNSAVWRGQIDYLMEEWKRFVELREELLEWIRKAEAYLERDENVYGFTVSELEDQIDKHKVGNYETFSSAVGERGETLPRRPFYLSLSTSSLKFS